MKEKEKQKKGKVAFIKTIIGPGFVVSSIQIPPHSSHIRIIKVEKRDKDSGKDKKVNQ